MGSLLIKKDAQYWGITLDDLARKRLNGTAFLNLMQEAIGPYRDATWQLVDDWARRVSWTDKKVFKTVLQFGALEMHGARIYNEWYKGTLPYVDYGSGAFEDCLNLISRKAYDEQKHGRIYWDAVLERGWAGNRRELFGHEYSQAIFGMKMFVSWLAYVGSSHPAVQHAGDSVSSEFQSAQSIHALGESLATFDPIIAKAFLAQEYEEMTHVKMGEYVVGRYASTPAIQFQCLWAAHHNLHSLNLALKSFIDFVEEDD
ncbi:MAG: hypothetical protein AB7V27_01640 [Candidatus Binatia bacterium]